MFTLAADDTAAQLLQPMKYLIVGLGNIGAEYQGTRHNIGFTILDALAEASNIVFTTQRYGAVAEMRVKNQQLVLLKPSTYMNLSGEAVRYWMIKEHIDLDHLLVIVDDIALPFGHIRIRPKGADGGHNGLKSINDMLQSQQPRWTMCWATPPPRSSPSCPSAPRWPPMPSRPSASRA